MKCRIAVAAALALAGVSLAKPAEAQIYPYGYYRPGVVGYYGPAYYRPYGPYFYRTWRPPVYYAPPPYYYRPYGYYPRPGFGIYIR